MTNYYAQRKQLGNEIDAMIKASENGVIHESKIYLFAFRKYGFGKSTVQKILHILTSGEVINHDADGTITLVKTTRRPL